MTTSDDDSIEAPEVQEFMDETWALTDDALIVLRAVEMLVNRRGHDMETICALFGITPEHYTYLCRAYILGGIFDGYELTDDKFFSLFPQPDE